AHAVGLVRVIRAGPAGLARTEATGPRADVAQDHDRGRALLPALPDVGAVRFLADGVERQSAQDALEVGVVLARWQAGANPIGMTLRGCAGQAGRRATHRDRRWQV